MKSSRFKVTMTLKECISIIEAVQYVDNSRPVPTKDGPPFIRYRVDKAALSRAAHKARAALVNTP